MARVDRFKFGAIYNPNQFGGPGEDASNRGFGHVKAYHKRPWKESPYRIPNEWICSRLGELIGLPVPPCVLTASAIPDSPVVFSTLDFNIHRDNLPPIDGEACFRELAELSTGVVMFDIWIANEDRHDTNLVVDNVLNPTSMQVFDHDQALFGGFHVAGRERFVKLRNRLGITGGTITGGNRHCLLDAMTSDEYITKWANRICLVPDYFIEKLCWDMECRGLIDDQDAKDAVEFLHYRKHHLELLIEQNRSEFTRIAQWKPGRLV